MGFRQVYPFSKPQAPRVVRNLWTLNVALTTRTDRKTRVIRKFWLIEAVGGSRSHRAWNAELARFREASGAGQCINVALRNHTNSV